jgi:SAM-dependent methyltransferase
VRDLVLETDWEAEWKRLVEARSALVGPRDQAYWDERSRRFAFAPAHPDETIVPLLEPWLSPDKTLIDVGAGVGRHSVALAPRLRHVIAVEPSAGMRELIPEVDNLSVVGDPWLEADVPRADFTIAVHMMYPIAEPVPFLEKLEAAARERVFVVMRDLPSVHPAEVLAGGTREPLLRHCLLLLRQLGVAPSLEMFSYGMAYRFASFESALEDCRRRAGSVWDPERGEAFLRERLRTEPDGSVFFEGEMTAGVVHWAPRR